MKKRVRSWSYLARRDQTYPCIAGTVFHSLQAVVPHPHKIFDEEEAAWKQRHLIIIFPSHSCAEKVSNIIIFFCDWWSFAQVKQKFQIICTGVVDNDKRGMKVITLLYSQKAY